MLVVDAQLEGVTFVELVAECRAELRIASNREVAVRNKAGRHILVVGVTEQFSGVAEPVTDVELGTKLIRGSFLDTGRNGLRKLQATVAAAINDRIGSDRARVFGHDACRAQFNLYIDTVETVFAGYAIVLDVSCTEGHATISEARTQSSAADPCTQVGDRRFVGDLNRYRVALQQVVADQSAIIYDARDRAAEPEAAFAVLDVVVHILFLPNALQQQSGVLVVYQQHDLFTALDNVGLAEVVQ